MKGLVIAILGVASLVAAAPAPINNTDLGLDKRQGHEFAGIMKFFSRWTCTNVCYVFSDLDSLNEQ